MMEGYPVFKPIEIEDLGATLVDMRSLKEDECIHCVIGIWNGWQARYVGTEKEGVPILDDPDAITFALRMGKEIVGAGLLYDIVRSDFDKEGGVTVEASFLAIGPGKAVEVLTERADGAKAYAAEEHKITSVVVKLRRERG